MSTDVHSKSGYSLYDAVTNKIVTAIEAGAAEFKMPWHTFGKPIAIPSNATTYATYRGVNVLSLWIAALTAGYPTGSWATYKQWKDIGVQVRRGERGTLIVFYKQIELTALEDADPDQRTIRRWYARPSWVFNAAQCEGYVAYEPPASNSCDRHGDAEAFIAAIDPRIEHGFEAACYRIDRDVIQMPRWEWFMASPTRSAAEAYYGVLLHELTHWTGAEFRLNRAYGKRFGGQAYAFEELIAEIGSAFSCSYLGISAEPRADHAAYVASWLRVLKSDPQAIFTAASAAQEAHEYLIGRATRNDSYAASVAES